VQRVLLAISREFGKSVDWLLTGKTHTEPKKGQPEIHTRDRKGAPTIKTLLLLSERFRSIDWMQPVKLEIGRGGGPASDQSGVCEEC
jgi:hypothetical protein